MPGGFHDTLTFWGAIPANGKALLSATSCPSKPVMTVTLIYDV
jgi:hypothetical protein